jgi:hypothetical protein
MNPMKSAEQQLSLALH